MKLIEEITARWDALTLIGFKGSVQTSEGHIGTISSTSIVSGKVRVLVGFGREVTVSASEVSDLDSFQVRRRTH